MVRYIKDGRLIENGRYTYKIAEEIYTPKSPDLQRYLKCVNRSRIRPIFRIMLLSETEMELRDITDMVISGNLTISYQNGDRRGLSLELVNDDGTLTPCMNSWVWGDKKFSLECGFICEDVCIWYPQGVFGVQSITNNPLSHTVSLSLRDKFALFGKTEAMYTIYEKTKIKDAVQAVLYNSYDGTFNSFVKEQKIINFPPQFENSVFEYRISKDYGEDFSSILISGAETLNCDVFYNERGVLTFEYQRYDIGCLTQPVLGNFKNDDINLVGNNTVYNFSNMVNHVIVIGNIKSGKLFEASATNNNPASPLCIDRIGPKITTIKDTNLYSDLLCQDRANYELINASKKALSRSFNCTYLPYFDVNKLILHEGESGCIKKYLTQSVSMSLNGSENGVNLELVDVSQLPFVS